jgi:hypothetical protein
LTLPKLRKKKPGLASADAQTERGGLHASLSFTLTVMCTIGFRI